METRQNYTVKEVIEIVIRQLEGIVVPVSLIGQLSPQGVMVIKQGIVDPIEAAKRNLVGCVEAINADEARQKAEQEKAEQTGEEANGEVPELRILEADADGTPEE